MKQENKEDVLLNAFEENTHDSKPYKSCKYIERTNREIISTLPKLDKNKDYRIR